MSEGTSLLTPPRSDDAAAALNALLTPAGEADPYPFYARLREAAPVFPSELGVCFASSYDTVREASTSADYGAMGPDWWDANRPWWRESTLFSNLYSTIPGLDPPDHTRLRSLVSRVFTARRVDALRPYAERLTAGLLDAMADKGAGGTPVDLMAELALPLPVAIIGELFGVPGDERQRFRQWVEDAEVVYELAPEPAAIAVGDAAYAQMREYFADLVAGFRRRPQDNLTSDLVRACDAADAPLTPDELLSMLIFVFVAGFETTTGLIGNGVVALAQDPGQARLLSGGPGAVDRAVEELARYDPPVQMTRRVTRRDLTLGGVALPAGTSVIPLLGAANRDPAHFPDPDRLDLARDDARPMSFGGGVHFCLGAVLGRMEVGAALRMLYQRFPEVELGGAPVRAPGLAARRHTSVPLLLNG
ncbi:cytochrome P450 [Actinomadura viridis]|uniref:Cytochrome P450 n=1 Tax=Actinomadura viridis TaxID=58110 RepID=A0A931GKX0_9ACTN|nr:cytochrome P450 [Actinomadura viridis]MBG6086856.1 cytochrome P450 [Actinomadura viridis]